MLENALIVGFTGTQDGMSLEQQRGVYRFIKHSPVIAGHHGDCIGADAEFDAILVRLQIPRFIHPPTNPDKRFYCQGETIFAEKPYLIRNEDIVDESNILLATPKGQEQVRSGTWATIRYAKSMQRKTLIIYPDGREERRFIAKDAVY